METQPETHRPVVVVGAGLAGLAAAATAARAGAPVLVLEARSPGGRARTDVQEGFRLNRGPHALYRGGAGRAVLGRLEIRPAGHMPSPRGTQVLIGGSPHAILSRRVLGARAVAQLTAVFARLAVTDASKWAARSAREWIGALGLRPGAATFMEAFVRLTTYVADLDRLPADLAISQLRMSFKGLDYLDGGWEQLTCALLARASGAGAQLQAHTPVAAIGGSPGAWEVRTAAGDQITAAAVVVAAGTPAATSRLLPAAPGWGGLGPEVTAACLDLGLRRPGTRFIVGIDEPLYLSPHCPPGNLAPAGRGLVHVMRYGARTSGQDREQLWALASAAGIGRADVVVERFLHRMVVASYLPPPGTGLAGRPAAAVPGAPGIFVAGDWAGPVGWLSDSSLASGEKAGLLAARAARACRARPDGKVRA
jgi:glycine/D-amino acid oxidase-like deaminating enzyme